MKKIYTSIALLFTMLTVQTSFAQSITESFDDITTLAANGWVMNNLSNPVGTQLTWFQSDLSVFPQQEGTSFIAANYNNIDGAGSEISNWLITPSRTFNDGDVITFYTRTVNPASFPDRLQVRLSTNGTSTDVGLASNTVGDFTNLLLEINPNQTTTDYPNDWTLYTITLSNLGAPTTGRLAFRYYVTNAGPNGSNSDYIGIDNFIYTPATIVSPNLTMSNPNRNYTLTPLSQVAPIYLSASLNNVGSASTNDAQFTANVYKAPDFVTPVYTATTTAKTLSNGASLVDTAGIFTPSTIGDYKVEFISTCTNNVVESADTLSYNFLITQNEYARDNGYPVSAFGIGTGPTGYISSSFNIVANTSLDSVLIALQKPGTSNSQGDAIGDSTRVVIFNNSGGVPGTIIGMSPKYVFTPEDTLGLVVSVHSIHAIGGGKLQLTPGTYFIAVAEYNTNMGLVFCDEVFKTNTFHASWTGQAWTPVEAFGASFAKTPVIRPYLNTCTAVANTVAVNVCAGSDYTYADGASSLMIALDESHVSTLIGAAANGCDSIVTENLTVIYPVFNTLAVNVCAGSDYTYADGSSSTNITADESHVSTLTGAAANGCDSIVTENVTVIPVATNSVAVNVCSGSDYTYADGSSSTNITVDESHVSTLTGAAANGCDSVVTENITVLPVATNTVAASVCAGSDYTYADGSSSTNITADESHVSTLTGAAANGCDSVVTENITVLPVATNTVAASVCAGSDYTYADGSSSTNITADESHVSTLVGAAANGCDSVVTENITVVNVDLTVTDNNDASLTANQAGAIYQWINCSDNSAIDSETNQTYTATADGDYAVVVTVGNCSDTSACTTVLVSGVKNNSSNLVSIYPNPTSGVIAIELSSNATIVITNALGQVVVNESVNAGVNKIDIQNQAKGVYMVKIILANNSEKNFKLIKE